MNMTWPEVVALGILVLGTVLAYGLRLYFSNRYEGKE